MSWKYIKKHESEKLKIEEETLKSTEETLALLHETQQCGITTAVELSHQGDQLRKIDGQLDHLNNTLDTSQKHINGLKSMFGGLKSWFSKKDDINVKTKQDIENPIEKSNLQQNMAKYNNSTSCSTPEEQNLIQSPDFYARFNNNMTEMSRSILILKSLTTDIGEEIDGQNILISDITRKTDEADINISQQNTQIKKILGK